MSNSSEAQYQSLTERVFLSVLTSAPCLVFLSVNVTMLWTLRSKSIFRETPRYCLLFNLLLADTLHMSLGQLLYLFSVSRRTLSFPICGALNMAVKLINEVSPLTLVVMSLERYVAVCFPLRLSVITSLRNTAAAVLLLWALFSECHGASRPHAAVPLRHAGSMLATRIGPLSAQYDQGYTSFLFVFVVAIAGSYVAVMLGPKRSALVNCVKARNMVLLHLFQLVLVLSSTVYSPLLLALAHTMSRLVLVWLQNSFYIIVCMLPQCLSSLIYGIRDQSIRPALLSHLLFYDEKLTPIPHAGLMTQLG